MIAIIGGGLTGLALGYELARRGTPHVVLEASARPGGVIRSGRIQGHLLEWGPQRARLTQGLAELVELLGLQDQLINAPAGLPLFVFSRGKLRLVPFSASDFLRSDIFSVRGKLRILFEPLTAGPHPQERVADLFTRKVGREAYENLLGPLYGGLYASDPADMVVELSLGHVLREFGIGRSLLLPLLRRGARITPPVACSFREGLQTLPTALFQANRANVRLQTPIEGMRQKDGGYVLEAGGETIEAERVVITTPASAASRLLRHAAPEGARRIAQLRYNPLAVVHLYAETSLRGLGYQVSLAERLITRGVTFNDSLFGRQGVYTAYLGGAKSPHIVRLSEEELATIAVAEFSEVTGARARVLSVEREWMPAWDTTWQALHGLELPEGISIASNWQSRPGMPGRLVQAKRLAGLLSGS